MIAIVDYGVGNLFSLRSSFAAIGAEIAVTADPAGVLRVFTNLIRNALEHGQKRMSILLYRQEETVVSAFSNDAAGLTREDVEHVFDRFFTADKMRTGQSTGLGLAIVKHSAAFHHASIELDSREGEGTTITVTFPAGE